MKVELKINNKKGAYYLVDAYCVDDSCRVHIGIYVGRIDEIISKLGEEYQTEIEIVRSKFCGWY